MSFFDVYDVDDCDVEMLEVHEADDHVAVTTCHRYHAQYGAALHSARSCPHTFLRLQDNLWVHINFIETDIHIPVCLLHSRLHCVANI